jgi:predicted PurR-regulated permease PerM
VFALALFLTYRLFQPILPSLVWGALLAVISARTYERIVSRVGGRRSFGTLAMGLIYLIVLIAPLLFVISEAMAYGPALAGLTDKLSSGELLREIEASEPPALRDSFVGSWLAWAESHFDVVFVQIAPHLGGAATWLLARFGDLGSFLFEFLLGCATALFLLHHRFAARAVIARLLHGIGGQFAVDLMQHTFDSTRGTFLGVIVAAIAQTVLSVAALVVAGVPGVIALAALTFLLALVQIGPVVTGAIATAVLFAQGESLSAVLILLWFLVVVASVDNLIRPLFAARSIAMPGYLAFLGALSGVLSFGLIGVFVGPVLVTLFFRIAQSVLVRPVIVRQ